MIAYNLEPTFLASYVGCFEFFIRLSEVNDTFDKTNDRCSTTRYESDNDLNDAFFGVAKVKLVNSQTSEEDPEDAGDNLAFIG